MISYSKYAQFGNVGGALDEHFHTVWHGGGERDLLCSLAHPRPCSRQHRVKVHGDFGTVEVVDAQVKRHQRAVRDSPLGAVCH